MNTYKLWHAGFITCAILLKGGLPVTRQLLYAQNQQPSSNDIRKRILDSLMKQKSGSVQPLQSNPVFVPRPLIPPANTDYPGIKINFGNLDFREFIDFMAAAFGITPITIDPDLRAKTMSI
jgi:hypothetical protein